MPGRRLLLALDFGGTKLAAALALEGEDHDLSTAGWLDRVEAPSPPNPTAQSDIRITRELVISLLAGVRQPLAAVGISFGGPVAADGRTVLLSHHVTGWEQVALCQQLEAELGVLAFMDNDGNAAALGEHRFGAGRGYDSLLYLTVSTGVGGGWILNGQPWRGADGVAGEVGHMVVDPQGPTCPCGKKGCVEIMASGLGITHRAKGWLAARPDEGQTLRRLAGGSPAPDAETVARAAAQGDELAWQILKVSAQSLGRGIGAAACLINPEVFVLGGGVTKAGDRWWQVVRQAARQAALPEIRTEIVPAALGDDAPLWGAIALAQDGLLTRQSDSVVRPTLTQKPAAAKEPETPSLPRSERSTKPMAYLEIINLTMARGQIRHALFDFDGTLSLIREGWQEVMVSMMVELLLDTPRHESEAELRTIVAGFVALLTGKQTIYQMIQLAEELEQRGGQPLDPIDYKWMYLERLWTKIEGRVTDLKAGRLDRQALMVPGSIEILEALRERGVTCYLASGTDEAYVLDECAALGLSAYFAGIYGALDDYQTYSKKMVIDRILSENALTGAELVTFGDGYVEIEDTKSVGGLAVGLATDEARRQGVDEWKRTRLIAAGADLIVPDFGRHHLLVAYLFEES